MSFAEFLTSDRRLCLLRGLQAAVQYKANAFLLHSYCDSLGHSVSADVVETDLAWLAEQGLATLERVGSVTIATLTTRGADVAAGRATVPGVQRPQPGL